eukprot:c5548_g1_i1.p1 GENE.c5548_g1_i1~~c5548_g1_i1.p1  ORF type:complete len:947 (-),score=238.61 c5548_g1_i1:386-3226(-)
MGLASAAHKSNKEGVSKLCCDMEQLNPEGIQQVVELLKDSAVPDTNVQRAVLEKLAVLNAHPDFNKYLTLIFVTATQDEMLRKSAGLVLKNNINLHFQSMTPDVQHYIKSGLLSVLSSPQPDIRRTVANNINTIAVGSRKNPGSGLQTWPELISILTQGIQAPDQNLVEGCFEVLELLCDDLHEVLDRDLATYRPTNVLIPVLLNLLSTSQQPATQMHCLSCIGHFLLTMPAILASNMNSYLQSIFARATSPDERVRKHVCRAFVTLVEMRGDSVLYQSGSVQHVVEYMIVATSDKDDDVSLEACEFWTAICRRQEVPATVELLEPVLGRVVPLLLSKMVYSQDELSYVNANNDDDTVADNDHDIRPFTHKARAAGGWDGAGGPDDGDDANSHGSADDDDDHGDHGDDADCDDDEEADPSGWNIRKCAASGMDNLAIVFGERIWPHLQPHLERNFNSPNWLDREASVLALGAVADGCLEGLKPHLGQLLQYLCLLLKDPQPLIRSISSWTLSRFSGWLVEQQDPERFVRPVLMELLTRIADSNKNVQRVACSALATLEDEAQTLLVPYLDAIVPSLMSAFQKYQAKNMLILYDALGTLADAVGPALNTSQYIQAIMGPVMAKWMTLDLFNRQLLPMLECLADLAQAMGLGFLPYAQGTFSRSCAIIQQTLTTHTHSLADPNVRSPGLDPVIWSLDLISGLCVALKEQMGPIIAQSQSTLMALVLHCLQDKSQFEATHQSALALLGDLAKASIDQLQTHVPAIMPCIATNLNPYFVSVCNNASWAMGEISVRVSPEQLTPFVDSIATKLIEIVLNPHQEFHPSLLENCAITIGRLGMVVPAPMSRNIGSFLPQWCQQIKRIHDPVEKAHAYAGLVKLVHANPADSVPHFAHVCDCIAQCNLPNPDLHDQFHSLLNGFKTSVGEQQWTNFFSQFPQTIQTVLQTRYHL